MYISAYPDFRNDKILSSHTNYSPHYDDVIMSAMASQITSLTNVYSAVCSGVDQRKHQSSASLAFVRGIHRGPVTRKMFLFDDIIMYVCILLITLTVLVLVSGRWGCGKSTNNVLGHRVIHTAFLTACYQSRRYFISSIQLQIAAALCFHVFFFANIGMDKYSISQEICIRFLLCCALLWLYIDWFSHIHQAYFTGTVAI